MGTWYGRKKQGESMIDYITRMEGIDRSWIVDSAVRIDAAYMAIRSSLGPVVGVVIKITHDRGDIGLKWMDESAGPYFYDCPDRILDKLTDLPCDNSREWRAHCRKHNARKRALKGDLTGKRLKIGPGVYRIDGRDTYKRGAWIGTYEATGIQYTIRRSALNRAEVVEG
jgi:hypothetical protein